MTSKEKNGNPEEEALAGSMPMTEADGEEAIDPDEVIPKEVLAELNPQQRKFVERSMLFMGSASGAAPSPLAKKINAEHINKIIENSDKEDNRRFIASLASEGTKIVGMLAVLALVGLVFLYAGKTKDRELAEKIFIGAVSAIGGGGVGYGIGKSK